MSLAIASVKDLRRIADAVGQLRERTIRDVEVRSDCRQLRIGLDDGRLLLVAVFNDEAGVTRLDVDVLRPVVEDKSSSQLEAGLGGGRR